MTVDILIAVAQKGGVENVINMTAPYLQKKGWEVRVVQLVWEGVAWVTGDIPFYPLLEGREGHDLEEFVQSYADFLEEHGKPQMILAAAWPYMSYLGKKAAYMCKEDITVISWLHAPVERYHAAGYGGYDSLYLADGHMAINDNIFNGIKNAFKNTVVFAIHNPVNFFGIVPEKAKKQKGVKKLFFIGRLTEEKRLDIIITAIGRVNGGYELHIIGEGEQEYKEFLMLTAKENGVLGKIHWYGWKENPWSYARDADALVLASEYEGFPLAAIEAQVRGIPVISTLVSGLVEIVKPGVNGFIFPFGDADALAEVLNAISAGMLPTILPEKCRKAVESFRMESALFDMECKLRELHNNLVRLKQSGGSKQILYNGDKISVIVPCYNAEKYIAECMESLLKQTLPLELLEIILIDDASVDKTMQILKEYEEKFPENILLISCDENAGPGAARNAGLNYASGEFIVFVDADDYMKEDMLQKLYEKIKLYDCDMAECGYRMFTDDGREKIFENRACFYNLTQKDEKRNYIVERGSFNSCWGKIYKREFLEKNQIFFPEHIFMEDIYFYQLCMMCADSCYVMPEVFYCYRYNFDSIMHSPQFLCNGRIPCTGNGLSGIRKARKDR